MDILLVEDKMLFTNQHFLLLVVPACGERDIVWSFNSYFIFARSFNESMSSLCEGKRWVTKLSSAGLVYAYFGRDIISAILEANKSDKITETVFDKIYENFIEEIDGIDNGVDQFDGTPR